jgi:hypothetical protein
MNELRAHPLRLATILVAGLMAFTTTYAVGSYGAERAAPAANQAPAVSATADPSQLPVVETPTPSPSGTGGTNGGGTVPADGGTGDDQSTAPAPAPAGQPEPTEQPVEHTTAPVQDEPTQPAPATSTYVAQPTHNTETPAPGGCGTHCK